MSAGVMSADAMSADATAGETDVGATALADAPAVAGAMGVAAEVGPFFGVEVWRAGDGWRPLDDLVTRPAVLAERVDAARAVIAGRAGMPAESVLPRVAASIVFLGLSARLVSPALAAAALAGVIPRWTVAELWWRPVPGGPWPMAACAVPGRRCGDLRSPGQLDDAAEELMDTVVSGVVGPVLEAFEERFRVSRTVLWGNVASALAGGLGMLAAARPDRVEAIVGLAGRMLDRGPLRGTGELSRPDPASGRTSFVRRSCCLFYRGPGAGTCGDCVLTAADVRRPRR
jgi:hypothetical protein